MPLNPSSPTTADNLVASPLPAQAQAPFTVEKGGRYKNRILADAQVKGLTPQGVNAYVVDNISEGMGRQPVWVFYHEEGKDEPSTLRKLSEFKELFEPI